MKPSYKLRFKLDKKNKFHMEMSKDTMVIMRKHFLSAKTKPYTFQEVWRQLNGTQVKKLHHG